MQKCGIFRINLQDRYSKLINNLTQQDAWGIYYPWKNETKVFLIQVGELIIPHVNNLKDLLALNTNFYYYNSLHPFQDIFIHNRLYPIPNRVIIQKTILGQKFNLVQYHETFMQYLQEILNEKCNIDNYLTYFSSENLNENVNTNLQEQQYKWGEIQLSSLYSYLVSPTNIFMDEFLNLLTTQKILLNNLQEGIIDENIAQQYSINKNIIYVGKKGSVLKQRLIQFYDECNSTVNNQIVDIDVLNDIVNEKNNGNIDGFNKRMTLKNKNDIVVKQSTILSNYGNSKILSNYSKEKLKIILEYLQHNNMYINLQQEILNILTEK